MQKKDNPITIGQSGHIGQEINDDLEKAQSSTILEKDWASSSVRIEHQPPKLGVEGSNPSPPATHLRSALKIIPFCLLELRPCTS